MIMAEEKAKREIDIISLERPDDQDYLGTDIGFEQGVDIKYTIWWLIPKTDEEAQERYGCDLADLVANGVRQLSTRPNYKLVGFTEDGELKENGHEEMQTLADGYKPGRRAIGTGQKKKAQTLDSLMSEMGIDDPEVFKKLAREAIAAKAELEQAKTDGIL